MNFVSLLRWTLSVVSAPLGFYAALFTGLLADGFLAGFCPSERVVSGLCTATWYLRAGDAIVIFGAVLAAVLVVLLPTLLAPKKRLEVAAVFYTLGAAAALLMSVPTGGLTAILTPAVSAALSAGALTLFFVRRSLQSSTLRG
jgi:hypothetical protein